MAEPRIEFFEVTGTIEAQSCNGCKCIMVYDSLKFLPAVCEVCGTIVSCPKCENSVFAKCTENVYGKTTEEVNLCDECYDNWN